MDHCNDGSAGRNVGSDSKETMRCALASSEACKYDSTSGLEFVSPPRSTSSRRAQYSEAILGIAKQEAMFQRVTKSRN